MKQPISFPCLLLCCGLWLSACGGGGSDSAPNTPTNRSPTANAGNDQAVNEQSAVQLNGTASDSDGSVVSTVWAQVSGTNVSLANSDTLSASFNSPTITAQENLTFSLTVRDNLGATASDQVTITVNPVNNSPTADAGTDYVLYEQDIGELRGTGTDTDGSVIAYNWEQISGPVVSIETPSSQIAAFTAPPVSSVTQLEFSLTVTDNEMADTSDQIVVIVQPLAEISGSLFVDTLLKGAYEVTADISVAPGVNLTISPGTILKFSQQASLVVAGTLIATGTEAEPIFFTYLNLWDITPSSSWAGISFTNSIGSSISYSVIENASNGLQLNGISLVPLTNNVLRNNSVAVSDIQGFQAMEVTRNTFVRNFSVFDGIRLSDVSLFSENLFAENPSIFTRSFYFDTTSLEQNSFEDATLVIRAPEMGFGYGTVVASNNWWGTTDSNEIGALIEDLSDDVTLQEIVFIPFLNAPPTNVGSGLPGDIVEPHPTDGVDYGLIDGPPSGPPTGLEVNETFLQLLLTWNNPSFNLENIEIWRSAENNLSTAALIGTAVFPQYVDDVGASASYYYWIRAVGTNEANSAFNDTAGTLGTTGVAP